MGVSQEESPSFRSERMSNFYLKLKPYLVFQLIGSVGHVENFADSDPVVDLIDVVGQVAAVADQVVVSVDHVVAVVDHVAVGSDYFAVD